MVNVIPGTAGDETLTGTEQDDLITGGDGRDIIYGGAGNDEITVSDGGDFIDAGAGDDTITLSGGSQGESTVIGGDGNDNITNSSTDKHRLFGGSGNDSIQARPGDVVDGGAGDDIIYGNSSSVTQEVTTVYYSGKLSDYQKLAFHERGIGPYAVITDLREGSPDGTDWVVGSARTVFSDGVWIKPNVPCYVAGTRILTQAGEVAIEALRPGDLVVTCLGRGAMLKPVVWIGRRRVAPALQPTPRRARPIRIRQDALADGVPTRDLLVSPSHALFLDGHLVHAESLVNGATITQESWPEVEYLHVELAGHDVILAEGTPAETYRDDGNRAMFGPAPVTAPAEPPPLCAPIITDSAPLMRALAARAVAMGWKREAAPSPWVLLDGDVIRAEAPGRFRLPPGGRSLRLRSPAACLGAFEAGKDRRILGLALVRLTLEAVTITADDPRLGAGFHGLERGEGGALRWTDGDADLTPALGEALARGGVLQITQCGACPAWVEPAEGQRRRA